MPETRRRPPTMADVAARAGVSHQTVSRVLNRSASVHPQTRAQVEEAIRELGYRRNHAARLLASASSRTVGVLTWGTDQYGPQRVLLALDAASRPADCQLATVAIQELTPEGVRAAFDLLLEQNVAVVAVIVSHQTALRIAQDVVTGVPAVMVEGDLTERPLTAAVDNVEGARLATRHLLELGHRRVVHLAGPVGWSEAAARIAGWRAELDAHGLVPETVRWRGDWSAASGYAAGQEIALDDDVHAVFAANDQMALGLVAALSEHGRAVPEDVSVVGFDDLPEAAYFAPPLTTVAQDFDEVGRRVMQLVERVLAGDASASTDLVPTRLVVRASTAPPA